MRNTLVFGMMLLGCVLLSAQKKEVCEDKINPVEDLNAINYNKCLFDQSSKKKKDKEVFKSRMRNQLVLRASKTRKNKLRYSARRKSTFKKVAQIVKTNTANKKKDIPDQILFALVDELPKFEACSNSSLECFNSEFRNVFFDFFKYPEDALRQKIQGKVFVRFVITKQGDIEDVKTFSPGNRKLLEDEVKRVLYSFPKFTPGKESGQNIDVIYSIPISFDLEVKIVEKEKEGVKNQL